MPTDTDSLDVTESTLSQPGDAPSSYAAGDTAYTSEIDKTFQRPVIDSGAGATSSLEKTFQRPVLLGEQAESSSLDFSSSDADLGFGASTVSTFDVVETALSQPGDAPSGYLIAGDAVSGYLDPDATSLRSIHAGASYRSRLDAISTVDFTENVTGALDMIFGQTVTSVGSGQTLYLGLFEDSTESEVSLPVPAGQVQMIVVRSSAEPGTGESATFTVRKNGADSSPAMTTTISGASLTANSSSNQVTCSTGDRISVKLVTSSGAAPAYYRFSLKYQLTS